MTHHDWLVGHPVDDSGGGGPDRGRELDAIGLAVLLPRLQVALKVDGGLVDDDRAGRAGAAAPATPAPASAPAPATSYSGTCKDLIASTVWQRT